MKIDFEGYIGLVVDQSAKESLKKLQSVANDAGKSGCEFVIEKCKLIKDYTEQKGKGQITKEEYELKVKEEVIKLYEKGSKDDDITKVVNIEKATL